MKQLEGIETLYTSTWKAAKAPAIWEHEKMIEQRDNLPTHLEGGRVRQAMSGSSLDSEKGLDGGSVLSTRRAAFGRILAPMVFVPGIMGSRLFKKASSEPIWPPVGWWDRGRFRPKSLRAIVDVVDREVSQNEPLFPLVYSELLRAFENMGYVLGTNFWIFPYDWTQSNRRSGELLASFINSILSARSEWTCVDVVNHSMGGLVTRAAARLNGAPIRRSVYIASPHYGSPKAYFILHPKIEFSVFGSFFKTVIGDLAWKWYSHRYTDPDMHNMEREIKWLACQLDSVFELLPDRFYLDQKHPMVILRTLSGEFPIFGPEATYYTDLCKFPSLELQRRVSRAMAFKEDLGASLPGNENLVVYSDSEETLDRIIYRRQAQWRFGRYQDSGQRGDSLVPVDSGSLNSWSKAKRVRGTHNGVPNSQETALHIREFLLS